jgi:predicted ATPase
LGATFRLAAGLQQVAPAGAIAVSAAVQKQGMGFFRFDELGPQTLPEVIEPVHVYACTEVAPVVSRLEAALTQQRTIFHGRAQELALLEACWTRVCRGEGQVVCLVGEAGIGKSRLVYECQQRLGPERQLTAQTLSYGGTMPYHAVIPLLRRLLGVVSTDAPAQQRLALHTRLTTLAPTLAADAPLLASLLGVPLDAEPLPALSPEAQRRRLQHACLQVLVQQAVDTPLCLLVEDGHWLDPSSQELLDLLVASLARRPILLLCTARPGFRHTWGEYTYFHQMAIAPLSAAETDALSCDIFRPYDASPAVKRLIRERSARNPFFVEELGRAMREQGLLALEGAVYELVDATHVTLPASIQGIVQARLDRLAAAQKQILQVAAVIGPEVSFALLHDLVEGEEDLLHHHLMHLQAAEFLSEMRLVPTPAYTFTHALVQEAAYQSLVRRATERSAYAEAIDHLGAGLKALATLPDTTERLQQELALHIALGAPLVATRGYAAPEVKRVYARARALCQHMAETPQLFQVWRGLGLFYLVRAEYDTAQELGGGSVWLVQRRV